MNLNTSGVMKTSYCVTRMMIADCKLQRYLDLPTVCLEVSYRRLSAVF